MGHCVHKLILCLCLLLGMGWVFAAEEEVEIEKATEGSRYIALKPDFVLNYDTQGRVKFLKIEITLRIDSYQKAPDIQVHNDALRHAFIMMMSQFDMEQILDPQGKEIMRKEVLEKLQGVLKELAGDKIIEQVLFTQFLVQR